MLPTFFSPFDQFNFCVHGFFFFSSFNVFASFFVVGNYNPKRVGTPQSSNIIFQWVLFLCLVQTSIWNTIITNWNGFHHHRAFETIRSNYEKKVFIESFFDENQLNEKKREKHTVSKRKRGNINGSNVKIIGQHQHHSSIDLVWIFSKKYQLRRGK